jgi:3-hydroxypropanoate dehydrogenase
MASAIDAAALDQLFLAARTHNKWLDKDVPDSLLKQLVDIMKMGPTSANCQPSRIVFVKSAAAKARLAPFLSEGNRAKTMTAPVCAIIGYDLEFYENLPRVFPHNQAAKGWFTSSPDHAEKTAFRNGTLQGAYFILAARALGLDTGPMSGYDQPGVDKEFFPDGKVKSNFLCSVGYGDASAVLGRLPRLAFDDMAKIL